MQFPFANLFKKCFLYVREAHTTTEHRPGRTLQLYDTFYEVLALANYREHARIIEILGIGNRKRAEKPEKVEVLV